MFHHYMVRWNLVADGDPLITSTSYILPVFYHQAPAILKIALVEEERLGNNLMSWWQGKGAAPVLLHEGDALLLERAVDARSLAEMSSGGEDDQASKILCHVASQLHQHKKHPPSGLIPLSTWFKTLEVLGHQEGGILKKAAKIAVELLSTEQDIVILHGDLHHHNVLNFGDKGWLAIDPKYLIGERSFDYANLFCNPDIKIATAPSRLLKQVAIVSQAAKISPLRLIKWIIAYAGLSASWFISDKLNADLPIKVAEMASGALLSLDSHVST